MMSAILAQHAPLIRDYPNAPPPPPAPPAPPTPPQPPVAQPIAFAVVTRPSLFAIIGSALGSTTLATVTCADASMAISLSEAVAGLTFSYAAKVLTVSGTPTGSTRKQRVVVSYVASDGSNSIRGSTAHEITLVAASEVLTIGAIAGITGRVGYPLNQVLCTPTANFDADVLSFGNTAILGLSTQWTWNRALRAGELRVIGTPLVGCGPNGGYSFAFMANQQVLGSGTASCTIVQGYEAPAPAPAPTPAPPPPAPSPPPVPSPAPAPGLGPDPFFSNVKVLLHFNAATGLAHDVKGNTFTNSGAVLTTGAVNEAADFDPTDVISGEVSDISTATTEITVDALVDINPLSEVFSNDAPILWGEGNIWNDRDITLSREPIDGTIEVTWAATDSYDAGSGSAVIISGRTIRLTGMLAGQVYLVFIYYQTYELTAGFSGTRFSPVVSLVNPGDQLVWSLGIFSYRSAQQRYSTTAFVMPLASHSSTLGSKMQTLIAKGGVWNTSPLAGRRFVHMAGGSMREALLLKLAAFVDGNAAASPDTYDRCALPAVGIATAPGAVVRIGGTCPLPPRNSSGLASIDTIIPFIGAIDEVRVTSANRHITAGYINSAQTLTVSGASRVIPWPNY